MLAGIEAGGTKIVCAVAASPSNILRRTSIPTGAPDATMADILRFLAGDPPIAAVGIGCFGPLDLDPASAGFGTITQTPKPGWSGVNLRRALADALGCPVAIDTDVNASGLAEATIGAGEGCDTVAYVTVGTGIGGGLIVNGRPLHGLAHPEMGHIRPRRHIDDRGFAGICPFHGDCVEGLASGRAIFARTGGHLSEMPADDAVWRVVGDYLGQLCATLMLMASPQRIVLGGGVMASNPGLFAHVRPAARDYLAGYVAADMHRTIVPPELGEQSGIIGALMMAEAGNRQHANAPG